MESNAADVYESKTPTKPMRPLPPSYRPVETTPGQVRVVYRGSCWLWALAAAGLAVALASLILNGILFLRLRHAGEVTGGVLDEAITALDTIPAEGFDIAIPISQTIQFSTTIPFKQDFNIPFQESFTINRTVRIMVDAGLLGRIPIDVPIYATIPIDVNVPVQIDREFAVQTEIPLEMEVPLHIEPGQFAVDTVILTIVRWLATIRELM
jgi:hypothetical protein